MFERLFFELICYFPFSKYQHSIVFYIFFVIKDQLQSMHFTVVRKNIYKHQPEKLANEPRVLYRREIGPKHVSTLFLIPPKCAKTFFSENISTKSVLARKWLKQSMKMVGPGLCWLYQCFISKRNWCQKSVL